MAWKVSRPKTINNGTVAAKTHHNLAENFLAENFVTLGANARNPSIPPITTTESKFAPVLRAAFEMPPPAELVNRQCQSNTINHHYPAFRLAIRPHEDQKRSDPGKQKISDVEVVNVGAANVQEEV